MTTMTYEDAINYEDRVNALEAGREMDATVAEKVFGWQWFHYRKPRQSERLYPPDFISKGPLTLCHYGLRPGRIAGAQSSDTRDVEFYSTHISSAWKVFLWLAERGVVKIGNMDGDLCGASFNPYTYEYLKAAGLSTLRLYSVVVSDNTFELAICRAALLAVGE